ncbi:acyl-CoA dehydrogenase family protein [Candidatus Poriferisocius sp.]|uniref:acyl-CoA dehydrogenase family protein n=1 Tax=Candidatus Poriferisocius sp. TaxID=3101276 RepID=UPI003B5CDF86
MDFRPNDDQSAVLSAVSTLLERHSGPTRLRALGGDSPDYDHDLDKRLEAAGFFDVAAFGSTNRLDAALVQEAISMALGTAATGYRLLVAPSLPITVTGPLAVVPDGFVGPARFAADADAVVVVGADQVRLASPAPNADRSLSRLGFPVGQFSAPVGGEVLDGVDPAEIRAWLQVTLAVEIAGALRFATDLTVAYVIDRKQFGRSIGSFQAVQHGLAECAIATDGARLLALEAAFVGSAEAAAVALTHALEATKVVFGRTHQYTGAMGFTQEYDLHFATMRLVGLRSEAAALGRAAALVARQRWNVG